MPRNYSDDFVDSARHEHDIDGPICKTCWSPLTTSYLRDSRQMGYNALCPDCDKNAHRTPVHGYGRSN